MIEIKCKGADVLPLDAIVEFQGNLKRRTKKDIEKIITSIKKYGFSFPFFIWNESGENYCLDGHGRIEALAEMRRQGVDLPLFPVVYVEAKDEAEAKQKLLRLNSQYGQMTFESVIEFAGGMDLVAEELSLPNGDNLIIKVQDYKHENKEVNVGEFSDKIGLELYFSVDEYRALRRAEQGGVNLARALYDAVVL